MPSFQANSVAATPASSSHRMDTIWASLNRLFRSLPAGLCARELTFSVCPNPHLPVTCRPGQHQSQSSCAAPFKRALKTWITSVLPRAVTPRMSPLEAVRGGFITAAQGCLDYG